METGSQGTTIEPREFRDVLGHFPTGVAVITSVGDDGEPIGMAVGSFTSVSLDPPLVAFLPDRGSSTFPLIRDAGRFCVNVLAGGQEALCRSFATRGADRFADVSWRPGPHTGSPILSESVAWIDCGLGDIHEAGDHYIVLGRVGALGIETPTLPLLFFQGGYGTFAPRSLVLASHRGPSEAVRMAEASRDVLEDLAEASGVECRVQAVDDDRITIVATAGNTEGAGPVGTILPFFPPFGSTLVAWGNEELREQWYRQFPGELSADRRADFDRALEGIRDRGWGVMFDSPALTESAEIITAMSTLGRTPSLERRITEAGTRMPGLGDPGDITDATAATVRTLSAPVTGPNGAVLQLSMYGFSESADLASINNCRDALLAASRTLSDRFGGSLV